MAPPDYLENLISWVEVRRLLVIPMLLALTMAWKDIATRRIPNYLTLLAAVSGLIFQGFQQGFAGLLQGVLGLLLGFGLLILPYLLGGMGAGDVKALASLGAWLGPKVTLYLFIYMALIGGVMALAVLGWRGLLWEKLAQARLFLVNWILCHHFGPGPASGSPKKNQDLPGMPYCAAIALGMVVVFLVGH